jgi:pimeloyl-ACP methyl ester carboxylesterase
VAGGGVASAHLAKAGLTVTSIAAAVALVAGLALLARGTGALVRALRGWWRLLSIPAGLAVLVFALYPLVVAVNATNRPPGRLGPREPADVGLSARDVSFATPDEARLSAWYAPGSNGAAVVLLHGAGSTRTAVLDHAAVLASHGYGVLLVDGRGHGRSEGHAMDLGWYGPPDVAGAISFLEGEGVGRVAVLGLSMGGEGAIAAAGTDPRIAAVVAEGVTGMQEADHGWLPGGVNGAAERILERVQYTAADLLSDASRPMPMRDAIAGAAPRPFLLVAAGSDPDEVAAARWFRAASPRSVSVWVVPGTGHTAGLATDPRGWEARVVAFLEGALLGR